MIELGIADEIVTTLIPFFDRGEENMAKEKYQHGNL